MTDRQPTQITSRKKPQQARSNDLVAAILEAAIQVLSREGARRFTTTRVAERAGVSVGSVYQYFPNKAAILFRLQSDEWQQTTGLLHEILQDRRRAPLDRLRALIHTFIRSECEEAAMRVALSDAAPLYRDAPEAKEVKVSGERAMQAFMREVLPKATKARREMAGELVKATMSAVGKEFSETARTEKETKAYANAMADMFCAYLRELGAT